jgi:hypothetical protein
MGRMLTMAAANQTSVLLHVEHREAELREALQAMLRPVGTPRLTQSSKTSGKGLPSF